MVENTHNQKMHTCPGACHCGAVRFEVLLPSRINASHCNCSMCAQSGFVHVIVPENRFRLLEGATNLIDYRFNTLTARHLFCRICGIKSFYRPRSHPDGYSVNLHCIELEKGADVSHSDFDGKHWRKNISSLLESEIVNGA
jgi:hypothetical protein